MVNKTIASLLASASLLLPALASAQGVMRGNRVLTPAGFCSVHQDGTKGVRFSGDSYTAWLKEYAILNQTLDDIVEAAIEEAAKNHMTLSDLQIGQIKAMAKKTAAEQQRARIDQGQEALCK